jgi:type I restriction enzyme M protein
VNGETANLGIFWLKDQSLEDADDLPKPDVLAEEIADDLEAALEQFTAIAAKLKTPGSAPEGRDRAGRAGR